MVALFRPRSNTLARVTLFGGPLAVAFVLWFCLVYLRSSYGTGAGIPRVQPVPFSHQHHAGDLGIDCRYCHTSVEHGPNAGIPATETCMHCHSQMWVGSDMLEPVRASYRSGKSLRWQRVYNLPGFVYFDHSIHVHKGIGCTSCHGRVDEMPFLYQVPSLLMEWCLDCHRQPERHLRPQADIFSMRWRPPDNQQAVGKRLAKDYRIRDTHYLTTCSVCHR